MLEKCCLAPMRERCPDGPLILILDSGGGSWLHVSIATVLLCHRYGAFPYILPSYTTKCLMPLDQQPHAIMSARWAEFKRAWSRQETTLSIFQALAALRRIVGEGLSEANQRAAWSHIGFETGSRILREKILVDRHAELFASKLAGPGDLPEPKSKSSAALDLLKIASPAKKACQADSCNAQIPVTSKFCGDCGAANPHFDATTADLYRPGRKAGWRKVPEGEAIAPQTVEEDRLAAGVGDLLAVLRKKKESQATTKLVGEEEPAAKKAKISEKAPDDLEIPAGSKPVDSLSDEEHDLDTTSGCVAYICANFGKSRRDDIKPIAEFFVSSHLKPMCRKEALWSVFQKEVVNKGTLRSTAGRSAWLAAWRANRAKRFAKVKK